MKVRSLIVGFALGIGLIGAATLASNAQNAPNANATQQKIYISLENLEKDNLAVIDLATFKEIKRLTVGSHPHGLTSPRSQSVLYAASELGGVVTLVDTVRDQVIKTFHVGFGVEPQNGAVTPDGRLLYQPSYAGYWQVFDTQKEEIIDYIHTLGIGHNTCPLPAARDTGGVRRSVFPERSRRKSRWSTRSRTKWSARFQSAQVRAPAPSAPTASGFTSTSTT